MRIIVCDGCRRRIDPADKAAAFDVQLGTGTDRADWCGDCVAIIRAELPGLAARAGQVRKALRGAESYTPIERPVVELSVRQRAMSLWPGGVNDRVPLPRT